MAADMFEKPARGWVAPCVAFAMVTLHFCAVSFMGMSVDCLTPTGVLWRSSPFEAYHNYKWSDVRAMISNCSEGRHGYSAEYYLQMSDGAEVGAGDSRFLSPAYSYMYDSLAKVLRQRPIAVDDRGMDKKCKIPDLANVLRRR